MHQIIRNKSFYLNNKKYKEGKYHIGRIEEISEVPDINKTRQTHKTSVPLSIKREVHVFRY